MKNVSSLKLLAGVALVSFMISCEHQDVGSYKEPSSGSLEQSITVEDGYLKFNSVKTAGTAFTSLNNSEKIADFLKKFPEFKSMYSSYNRLVSNDIAKLIEDGSISDFDGSYKIVVGVDGKKEYGRAIVDPALASMVNQKGLLQIGDTLYKFSEEKTLKVHVRYKEEILSDSNPHVISKVVQHRTIKFNTPSNAKTLGDHNFSTITYNPGGGASNRRYTVMGWSTNYWFPSLYWSTGVNVKHQRDNWWGWGAQDATILSLNGYFTLDGYPRGYAGQTSNFNFSVYNTNEIQYRYAEDWSTSNVGTIYCWFNWSSTGNDGKPYGYSADWTQSI